VRRDQAAALLRRLHEAQERLYRAGDEQPVRAVLSEAVVWHVPGSNRIAGDHHGRDRVLAYMRRRRDLAGATMRMYPREVLVGDADHVASRTDGTATIAGVERRWSTLGLYRVRAGQILECWLLPLEPAAFDDIWR
jgi:ketosteroid isomerase-like protein